MRVVGRIIMVLSSSLTALASPTVGAGITVTEFQTGARVNGYAPTSQTQYFEQQTLTNVSPALAEVSGDWMGPNAAGSTNTWHYVGSARSASATTYNADILTVTGAGSFAYTLDTTPDFIDPSSIKVYGPGGVGSYSGFFETDVPATFSIAALLNQWSRVRLSTLSGSVVFNYLNVTTDPVLVSLSGGLALGQYRFLADTGLGAPNLPNGVNHYEASGGYEGVTFIVQIPEPNQVVVALWMIGTTLVRRGKRCARAD